MKANDVKGMPEDLFLFDVQEAEEVIEMQKSGLLPWEV